MPVPRHAHYSVIPLLLALIDLVAATPRSIEADHYEGLVDPTRPIGTLQSIAVNVGSASALQNVTPSTMKFSGKAVNEESTMITIAGVNWGSVPSLSHVKAAFGPGDMRMVDRCYKPTGLDELLETELERSYATFSIPQASNVCVEQLKLCSVDGSWYIFPYTLSNDAYQILMHPILIERYAERNPRLESTNILRDNRPRTSTTAAAAIPPAGATRKEMTLTTATASRTAIAATAPEGRSTALTNARILTAPFPPWIAGVGIPGLEEMEVPSRVGDPFKSLPLADVGELPVGSLVNSDDTEPFYLASVILQTDEAGRQLGQLNLASSALSLTGAPTTYFQFANATEDTPPSNVLILPLMPLIKKGCDADCYIFGNLTDPADQAEVEASLTAAGREFGINNLTLESIRLHRSGVDGGHFELRLGAEPSDPGKPSIRVQLAYTPFISDDVRGVYGPHEAGGSQPQEVRSLSQPRKRRLDEPSLADGGEVEKKDCMDC
ncbi:hypothetical protein FOZ63_000536 [Perkinsus olseni]|uniref:Uncharacterized protein n=1 Tax=Perkinsus olseni TaxID=32597 RepID=A0A7J6PUM7_PEROL|nr:hypothetical protein FOZ62_016202 [Perkinsus olseni]KAF4735157.1 hypothetical protein FOZ63_000536 [Perkinsus olseni]